MLRRSFFLCCAAAPALRAGAPTLRSVKSAPTGPGSRSYSIAASLDGDVYLAWIETRNANQALKVSRLAGASWTEPRIVASDGDEWFINAMDHTAIGVGPGGRVMVNWLFRPDAARDVKFGYGLRVAFSSDHGRSWRQVYEAGADNTADYTGFVGFSAGTDGFQMAYLAPLAKGTAQRNAQHLKTVRLAEFSLDGENLSDTSLDNDVCTCCPLSTARTAEGPVVVYRDHTGEIRDISIVRRVDGKWTEPRSLHHDGWNVNGCPGNGAEIKAAGDRAAAAWFTAADDEPKVLLALSNDSAASFSAPIRIDSGNPTGWADVALLGDGSTAVSWLEKRPGKPGVGDLMVRIADRDGRLGASHVAATSGSGRSTGVPRMVRSGDRLVFAWRADEQVRTAVMDPN